VKLILAGGTGHLGTLFAAAHHAAGDEIVVLSRTSHAAPWRVVHWDAKTLGPWTAELDGADAVVNFAGRSVNCRYTRVNREAILASRIDSTQAIGAALAAASAPPNVWLQMSTATIYAHRYDAPNDERTGIIGGNEPNVPETWRFSIDVATQWEAAADAAAIPNVRTVKLRAAIVMSPGAGGPFDILLRLVRLGLGGQSGDGRQFVSWIHGTDFVRALDFIIANDVISGAINVASPNPLPNSAFMRDLRAAWGMPIGIPSPAPLLELGARVIGTETELVLKSRRVVPTRLTESNFTFNFPTWNQAAVDLCTQVRTR
jgi:uncharacterized protein (TIGR01777 family)